MGEHSIDTAPKRVWKCAISSRDTGLGSGLRRLAAKVAFAMAIWCDAILFLFVAYAAINLCRL